MPRDEPLDDLPLDEARLISPQRGTGKPKTQALPRHRANGQRRRPKTLTELRVGWELVEIYDNIPRTSWQRGPRDDPLL